MSASTALPKCVASNVDVHILQIRTDMRRLTTGIRSE